jgi:hypothetical protein
MCNVKNEAHCITTKNKTRKVVQHKLNIEFCQVMNLNQTSTVQGNISSESLITDVLDQLKFKLN